MVSINFLKCPVRHLRNASTRGITHQKVKIDLGLSCINLNSIFDRPALHKELCTFYYFYLYLFYVLWCKIVFPFFMPVYLNIYNLFLWKSIKFLKPFFFFQFESSFRFPKRIETYISNVLEVFSVFVNHLQRIFCGLIRLCL